MSSITIHGLDDATMRLIKERAASENLSLNKTIKKLLESSLGVRPRREQGMRDAFEEFLGVWSAEESKAFESATQEFNRIDESEW